MAKELSASLEDYLEAIFQIVREKQAVRAKDIGRRLDVSRSSVTGALHALADRALINYAPYDVITLTEAGRTVAKEVVRRHEVLREFFLKVLRLEWEEADSAACRVEHAIGTPVLERFVAFVEFVDRCPHGGPKWAEGQGYFCLHDQDAADDGHQAESRASEPGSRRITEMPGTWEQTTFAAPKPGGEGGHCAD